MKHVNLFGLILFLTNPVFSQYDMGPLPGFGTPQPSTSPPTYANIPEPKHVLVVYASNILVSGQIKNAYVAARSIPATNEYGIDIPPNGQGAFLAQNGEEIRGNGNAGWLYYMTNIAAYIENHLSTTYNSEGQLLKDVIRYIVFCKGIPHKVRSVPYIWNSLVRKNVSTDALACMLFQNVLSLYDTPYYFVVNPLFKKPIRILPSTIASSPITLLTRNVGGFHTLFQGWTVMTLQTSRL